MSIIQQRRHQKVIHKDMSSQKKQAISVIEKRRQVIGFDPAQPGSEQTVIVNRPDSLASLEQCQAAVNVHVQRLKDIKDIAKKIEYKKTALLDIKEFVMDYFNSDHNYPNRVAVIFFIWSMDCGNIDTAIPLGLKLIEQKQILPKNFKSSFSVFLCDKLYDWAAEKLKNGESASPYLDNVIGVLLRDEWELYEPVGSKMFAMAAKHADLRGDNKKTAAYSSQALEMNTRAGVKTIMEKATAQLAKKSSITIEKNNNQQKEKGLDVDSSNSEELDTNKDDVDA